MAKKERKKVVWWLFLCGVYSRDENTKEKMKGDLYQNERNFGGVKKNTIFTECQKMKKNKGRVCETRVHLFFECVT